MSDYTSIFVDIVAKTTERAFTTGIVPGMVTVSFDVKNLTATAYAVVGVKTQGVTDLLYSKVMALK